MKNRNVRMAAFLEKETLAPYLLLTILAILLLSACTPLDKMMGIPPTYDYYKGYIDKTGKTVIEPKFSYAGAFSGGLASASLGLYEGQGYIDKTGNFVIKPSFRRTWPFSEGLARVQRIDFRYCFIDKTGSTVVEIDLRNRKRGPKEFRLLSVKELSDFHDGLARVQISGVSTNPKGEENTFSPWGFIDKTGKYFIEPVFTDAQDFQDGVAVVCAKKISKDKTDSILDNIKICGYVNKGFRLVEFTAEDTFTASYQVPPLFQSAHSFCDGLAQVYNDKGQRAYIDKKGNLMIDWFSPGASSGLDCNFREGLAVVGSMDKCGYMNTKGALVIPFQFQSAKPFYEGLAAVKVNGLWGYIDKTGKMVVLPRFSEASPFSESLAWVEWGDSTSAYIDRRGEVVIQLPTGSVGSKFSEGLASVAYRRPRS
jgi:hypothetical protein